MHRREALTVGALLVLMVLAGCSAAGSLDMRRPTDDVELAQMASRPVPDHGEGASRTLQIARRAIENGSTTVRGSGPEIEPGRPFVYQNRYYDVSRTVIDRQQVTAVDIAVDYNGTAPGSDTVAYKKLSPRDREMLGRVLPPQTDRRSEGFDFGIGATYNATERNRSRLLSEEPEAVRYDGDTYPIDVRDTRQVTLETVRYTADVVANSSTAYASHLRSEYAFELSGLSVDERKVVETAIDDTYYAESPDDEAFRSVLVTFRQHEAIHANDYLGQWLVRYKGGMYVADLSWGGFEQE